MGNNTFRRFKTRIAFITAETERSGWEMLGGKVRLLGTLRSKPFFMVILMPAVKNVDAGQPELFVVTVCRNTNADLVLFRAVSKNRPLGSVKR